MISVVLPCLNEEQTIAACVRAALRGIENCALAGEVLCADNAGTDQSARIAAECGARVVHVGERGYGAAVLGGIHAARAPWVVMADADGSYDLKNIAPFAQALRGGADLVMGNRFAGKIEPGAMPILNRYLGNPVLSALGRLLSGARVGDFHCGIRAFRREKILALGLQSPGMELASEMIAKAQRAGLHIQEVPVTLRKDGRGGRPSHLRPWRDGARHVAVLARCALA